MGLCIGVRLVCEICVDFNLGYDFKVLLNEIFIYNKKLFYLVFI